MIRDSEEMAAAQALVGRRASAVKLEGRFWPTLGGRMILPPDMNLDGYVDKGDAVAVAKRHRNAARLLVESCDPLAVEKVAA